MATNFNSTTNKAVTEDGTQDLTNKTVNGVELKSDGAGSQALFDDGNYKVPAGAGDMVGPASSGDENIPVFDGLTGKLLKDSGVTISSLNADIADKLSKSDLLLQEVLGPVDFDDSLSIRGIPGGFGENVYVINTIDDFPNAPVGGVIELTDGDEVSYLLGSKVIDLGANSLKCTGGRIHISGLNPTESEFVSTSSNPLISMTNCGADIERVILRNPNGDSFEYAGDGATTGLVLDRVLFASSQYIAQNISGAVAASFNRCVFLSSTVGGVTFGSSNSQCIFLGNACGLQSGFLGWTGSLLDLGAATFDLINISNNRVFPGSGDTFLTGAAGGANVNLGGAAELINNLFIGLGNSVTTITGQDDKWLFDGNSFNDSVRNTRAVADAYLTASQPVTINTAGVYEFIGGTNWDFDVDARFSVSTDGIITYDGLDDIDIVVTSTATISKAGGGSEQICLRIAIDGVTQSKTTGCTQNSTPTGVFSQGLFTISNGTEIRMYVANLGSTDDVDVATCNVIIQGNRT